jgi:hypothetical protein
MSSKTAIFTAAGTYGEAAACISYLKHERTCTLQHAPAPGAPGTAASEECVPLQAANEAVTKVQATDQTTIRRFDLNTELPSCRTKGWQTGKYTFPTPSWLIAKPQRGQTQYTLQATAVIIRLMPCWVCEHKRPLSAARLITAAINAQQRYRCIRVLSPLKDAGALQDPLLFQQ